MHSTVRANNINDFLQPASLYDVIEGWAERTPEAVAITAPGQAPLTYRRLRTHMDNVIRDLCALGIGRNDRVAAILPNGPEMAAAFLTISSGAAFAPLNPDYRANEFNFFLSDLEAKALIVPSGIDSPALAVARKHSIPIIEWSPVIKGDAGAFTLSSDAPKGIGSPNSKAPDPLHFAQPSDIALILYTSGTTSKPKRVPLTHANLLFSARNIAAGLRLTEKDRCLNVMPLFHIHGLVGAVLSSLMAGSSLVCASGFDPERFFSWLKEFHPTWYTAVPTIHQAVLSSAQAQRKRPQRRSLRFIRSSSSPLPPKVMAGLEELFDVPVIEAYGMTEAAHQITVNPLPPLERKPGSVGVAMGTEIAVRDEQGRFLTAGGSGEILIRGANVIRSYENNPETNEEAFTDGWLRTGDIGHLDKDGYLFITGRLKEIINRGGEKVSPREIDEALLEHPDINEAAAFAVPHPTLGEDIAAAVVLGEKDLITAAEIRRFAAARLADFKIPSLVLIVDQIPKGPTGKIQRMDLAEKLGLGAADSGDAARGDEFFPPHTSTEEALAAIWSEVLGISQVGVNDDFFLLGGDSIQATGVISRAREATGVELSFLTVFENRTLAQMARSIETASREAKLPATPDLQPIRRDGEIPLSYAQERMWFIDQLEPGNPAYNRPASIRLTGPLSVPVLEQCLYEILRRHEVLRTTFPSEDGRPVQVISSPEPLTLPVRDLSGLPEGEREAEARREAADESRLSFDLAKGPLVRARVLRLGQEEHLLLLTMHHIVFDGWSMEILLHELSVLYKAFSSGQRSPLPELPIQYGDFAVWQRQFLETETENAHLSYWRQQLGGNLPVLQLPVDYPRPPVQSFRGARQSLMLPKELSHEIKALSRRESVTLFMTLLAAFEVLLHRYTGQDDIVLGTPVAGRRRPEIEKLIGLFVNSLALRLDLSGRPTFRELLQRVREVALGAYAHQDFPFEKLVEKLQPERDPNRNPIFQVMFQLRNVPGNDPLLSELKLDKMEFDSGIARLDLTLEVEDRDEGLFCLFEYNTDLFDGATISRMQKHFQALLQGIVADPDQRIDQLPLLTKAERHQLLVEWNDTDGYFLQERCLHQLFEAQAGRTPDSIAVTLPSTGSGYAQEERLTYQELNRRANKLARYLQTLGVGPEVLVGVCAERSLEIIIGMLAILKAGGAYVPLDPAYPKERLAFMLEDAQVKVLLTQRHIRESLFLQQDRVVCLDSGWEIIARQSDQNLSARTTPENLAYVIYTSGSTGRPKGVQIYHRSVCRLLETTRSLFGFGERDVWTLFHSYSFDFSVWEIWGALLHGSRLVVVPLQAAQSPALFRDLLRAERVTVLNQTPSALRALLEAESETIKDARDLSLRLIICGGEAFPAELASRLLEWGVPVWNIYGPTEATVWAAINHVRATGSKGESIAIGRPIADRQIYLLDHNLQLVPVNVPGELHIGGGLARGYLNRSGLTAERFIPNPFGKEPGARLYKTGDLARYQADGNIEFLGRIDHQVKVRGFRIELGEIEAALADHPGVRQSVVTTREDEPGKTRLVAYVAARQDLAPNTSDLRRFLKDRLPEYMVPSAFVFLKALPLTPSGKIDRRGLPAPDQSRPELESAFVEPRTPTGKVVAKIWAEVLKLEKIGIHDNFFDLGGHSLFATQVISRLRDTFRVEITLRSLFESPTVAGLVERIEGTCREQQGLQAPPLRSVSRDQNLPLSFAQQRLWFLDQWEPGSSTYNVPVALRLRGMLNVKALEQSLNESMRRHETLRTIFAKSEGEPIQIIAPSLKVVLPIVDLQELHENERESRVRQRGAGEARRPFDLAQGPLLRSTLLRLGPQDHILLLTLHHIISDGWSLGVFFRELSILYNAFSSAKPSPLSDLPIQYADFVVWQRQWLQGEVLEKQLAYWRRQLADLPVLELPTDRPRPPVQTYRGASESLALSRTLTQALKDLSRRESSTLFMTLLAAFKVLLHKYTRQNDIVVGAPIAGRNQAEFEGLIGFFVNSLVLRTDLSGDPSFRELLARVRGVALSAYAHQDLPFEKLVEELQPERSLSHSPLFEVMFILQNAPMEAPKLTGLTVAPVTVERETSKFALTLEMIEKNESLNERLEYNTDLFDEATIKRMISHYRELLKGIVADPDRRLSELPLLTEAERHQLLVEWNDTRKEYPREKSVPQLFEEQAERTPEAVAVEFEYQQLTYRDLNRRANQLAHYLKNFGVGQEVLVGICMERSLEMIVGLLGILKAGGAYVPLDPAYPKDRLAFMLEDSRAAALLTQQRLLADLPEHEAQVVCLDRDSEVVAQQSEEDPAHGPGPENLAYVIYTSGSTGQPKGCMNTHRGISNRLLWMQDAYRLDSEDRVLQKTPFSFDVSVWEFFWPLATGTTLVIARSGGHQDPDYLVREITKRGITTIHFVPSMLQAFLEAEGVKSCSSLKRVICSGEALSYELQQHFFSRLDAELHNLYGPTEAAVDVTHWKCRRRSDRRTVSIGRPVANTEIYLLDSRLETVPAGIAGELCIGGVQLARGYLNRPDLTAEKFIPNPFSEIPGARLYKTGDLARYLPDGDIEFLGRIDHQVKIRGFRIELGEIETVLAGHPGVSRSVAMVREDELGGQKRLVAYVVAKAEFAPTVSELRGFLKNKLPEYMVPSAFVMLDALPLTPSGKVDRRALPAPDETRPDLKGAFVAPRTPMEESVAGVWAKLLHVEKVGIRDNFFDLGGHSLLATQVISRLREAFQIEISLRSLFEAPTVACLVERIGEARRDPPDPAPAILPLPCGKESPLSISQERFWFLNQLEPNSSVHNIPYGFRLKGLLRVNALERTLGEIVRRHEVLRTAFSMRNGKPVQIVAEQWQVKLPLIDLTALPDSDLDAEVQRLFEDESRRPFDLSSGLMLRATLLRLKAQEHVLFLTIHHIAFDHWSIEVLYREMSLIYKAFSAGEPCPLANLPIQYKHYAIWQRKMLRDSALENHIAYWKQQLSDTPPVLHLPTDYPRPPVQTFRGARVSWVVPKALADALEALGRQSGATLFMTLLAAFKILLHRLTGQDDIVVGSPVAGRDRSETEDLIGLFLNTLVLSTSLSGTPTFRELLTRVRATALGAYDHSDLPFEKLLEELNPTRDLSRTPVFQVFFNLFNFEEPRLDLEGTSVQALRLPEPISNFDLTLYARQHDDATRLSLVYNMDLFSRDRMVEMLEQYKLLLSQIVEKPDEKISRFSLVTPQAGAVLPDPTLSLGRESIEPVHHRFSKQARRVPERMAISNRGSAWSYRDLECCSNQLAHALISSGIRPGNIVAIYGYRSASLVWPMLGVLKAGAAFIILDPGYPPPRLINYLGVAKPQGWIQLAAAENPAADLEKFVAKLGCQYRLTVPEPNPRAGQNWLSRYPDFAPAVSVGADDLAYVAFTSGTTGTPQAILGTHRPLSHFLRWHCRTFDLRETDRFSLLSGLSHDPLLRDIFTPLWMGATLYIPESDVMSPGRLADWMTQNEISVAHLTPAMGSLLAPDSETIGCESASLRYAFFGGDVLTKQHVHRLRKFAPLATCVNFYGATETPQAMGYFVLPNEENLSTDDRSTISREIIPLGQGIADVQLLVLNSSQQLAGVGELGEIAVRTPYLARGYLENDAMTQARFLPDPFTKLPEQRLYQSGDKGRYLPDGTVAFAGRNDRQVKIRGFRVELGEIEVVLGQHPLVRQTVVLAREDATEGQHETENQKTKIENLKLDKRLVAYVVPNKGTASTVSELRSFLKRKLPDYLVPSTFVMLDALPLTPNGKVDRKALPEPDQTRPELKENFIAPRNAAEKRIAEIWAQLLNVDQVGVHDNFFDLGGHSLLATQVISRLRDAFRAEMTLRLLFEHPTVAGLAERIDTLLWAGENELPLVSDSSEEREEIEL